MNLPETLFFTVELAPGNRASLSVVPCDTDELSLQLWGYALIRDRALNRANTVTSPDDVILRRY